MLALSTVLLLLAVAGCAGKFPTPMGESHPPDHPQCTAVGASFPGVNQGTQTTTATRSTDT